MNNRKKMQVDYGKARAAGATHAGAVCFVEEMSRRRSVARDGRIQIDLLRAVHRQVTSLDHFPSREMLRLDRRCVGCEEQDGARYEPGLGWVCEHCDEVLDLVFENEIEDTREARRKVEAFVSALKEGSL